MDRNVPDPAKRVQRKMKFIPKLPPKKDAKPVVKTEVKDEFESAKAKELMRRFNDSLATGRPKVDKKHTPVQVAFGYGASTSSTNYHTHDSKSKPKTEDVEDDDDDDYQEQWETDPYMNYDGYHPVRVPMRKPYSGKPEIQNYEELAKNTERRTNPAKDLGLLDAWQNNLPVKKMLFLQLPFALPMDKRPAAAKGVDTAAGSQRPAGAAPKGNTCRLDELPRGHMGKLLVYKSGKLKLKLGDTLFYVSTGPGSSFAQDVAVVDIQNKSCCILGELNGLATVTPDVESIQSGLTKH